jgi:hypothetical protein
MQVMALAECGSRAIVGAVFGTAAAGERTLAADLIDKVEPDMLVTADACLFRWWRYAPGVPHPRASK